MTPNEIAVRRRGPVAWSRAGKYHVELVMKADELRAFVTGAGDAKVFKLRRIDNAARGV